jgi:thioredoxin 1
MTKIIKTVVVLAIAGIAFVALRAPDVNFSEDTEGGIQFQRNTFNEALQRAKTENKLVFVDVYAVWCGPCKRLKAKTFANKEVGKFFNASFVNVALDGESEEGSTIAAKYGVNSYPTLLFINSSGEVVLASSGYMSADDLTELGKNANNKLNQ